MTGLALAAGVALAALVVVLVALPFLREPTSDDDRLDAPTAAEEARLSLVEERDRALAALREIGSLRRQAAAALRALDGPQE